MYGGRQKERTVMRGGKKQDDRSREERLAEFLSCRPSDTGEPTLLRSPVFSDFPSIKHSDCLTALRNPHER